jgi:hypothetical protein
MAPQLPLVIHESAEGKVYMKLRGMVFALTLAVAICFAASAAKADQNDAVSMLFQSNATFSGTVTFADDYSSITGVNGILTGYQYGTTGYLGSGSDPISWVYSPVTNFAADPGNFSNYLMDGTPTSTFFNVILFSYNYSGGFPVFAATDSAFFFSGTTPVNGINPDTFLGSADPIVSGTILPTPEPSSLLLLGAGLASLLGAASKKRLARAAH